ncbi:MAG: hypothetical protein ABI221_01845 [Candidatus Saccharimonadales bacterium]
MKNLELIESAIQSGLNYIASQQLPNGAFTCQSSPSGQMWQDTGCYQTVFSSAIMLGSLSAVDNPAASSVCEQLASFLLGQRSPAWSFNYWSKAAKERQELPYPDDLDDTFCALIALHHYQPSLIDNQVLAQVTKLLVACEQQPGGPYYTWLAGASSSAIWRDVDVAVNCNVAYFLQLINVKLPGLDKYLAERLASGDYSSQYYPSNWPLWYYLARWCPNEQANRLRQTIEQALIKQSAVGAIRLNPLQTALCLNSLTRLGSHSWLLKALARRLLSTQQADGSWPAAGFCFGPSVAGQATEHGSEALSTTLALQALNAFQASLQDAQPLIRQTNLNAPRTRRQATIKLAVRHNVAKLYGRFPAELSQPAQPVIERLCKGATGDEICLFAYRFAQSLAVDSALLGLNTFIELGCANLLGWVAYTIYDDILDGAAVPARLPAANVGLRASRAKFGEIFADNPAFLSYIDHVFDSIDQANAWELSHCRATIGLGKLEIPPLPNYGDRSNLGDRSFGHALAPLGVLVLLGEPLASPAFQSAQSAMRNYLIARQLLDELHDWPDDLANGQLSYVVSEIVRELGLTGSWATKDLLLVMRRQFWHHTLGNICDVVEHHLTQAELLFRRSHLLQNELFSNQLLMPLRISLDDTRKKQKQIMGFLQSYRTSPKPRLLTLS